MTRGYVISRPPVRGQQRRYWLSREDGIRRYWCPRCGEAVKDADALDEHMRNEHVVSNVVAVNLIMDEPPRVTLGDLWPSPPPDPVTGGRG